MKPDLIEPAVVPDVFVMKLAFVEPLGDGMFRLIFATRQERFHGEGSDLVVSAKLIVTEATMKAMRSALEPAQHGLDDIPPREGAALN